MAESKTEKMRKLFADKQVSTEQLEDVAGGCTAQIAQDSRYLNVLLRGHLPFQGRQGIMTSPDRGGGPRSGGGVLSLYLYIRFRNEKKDIF